MGLSVAEFAALTPFHFDLKCRGYLSARDDEEMNFRRLAHIIFMLNSDPKVSKKTSIDDIWPTRNSQVKKKQQKVFTKKTVSSMLSNFKGFKNVNQDG